MARGKSLRLHHQKTKKYQMVFSLLRLLLIVLLIIPSSEASQDFDPINYLNTIETIRGAFIQQEG